MARAAAALSGSVLMALGVAYYLTYEPAPEIRILWQEGVVPTRRAEIERMFLLVNPRPFEDRLKYDLLDTRATNLFAIVHHPDVRDTDNIDRQGFTIPPQIPYGSSWMWVGHRLPVLRTPGVVKTIVAACSILLALSVTALVVRRRGTPEP